MSGTISSAPAAAMRTAFFDGRAACVRRAVGASGDTAEPANWRRARTGAQSTKAMVCRWGWEVGGRVGRRFKEEQSGAEEKRCKRCRGRESRGRSGGGISGLVVSEELGMRRGYVRG